jgi:hypothetical protein
LISGKDLHRKKALESAIGYMLSTYKDSSCAKAVIFLDELARNSYSANGGTGKSLVGGALAKIRSLKFIASKNFDAKSRFAFMDVTEEDRIFMVDDLPVDFDLQDLFPVITNDLNVEPKGKNRYTIPFSKSPKILITSNYPVGGIGTSYARRMVKIQFAPYFSDKLTPEMEFGGRFFDDWDSDEWNRFDRYMIHCIQVFLKNGLVETGIDSTEAELKSQTSSDFFLWATTYLETNVDYDLRALLRGGLPVTDDKFVDKALNSKGEEIISFRESCESGIDQRRFNVWISKFHEFKGWQKEDKIHNGYKIVYFKK